MIFDTHCHGYWHGLAHRQVEVCSHMRAAGVLRSVQIGTDLEKSRVSLAIARDWGADTWCTAGIHPTGCQDLSHNSVRELTEQLERLLLENRDKIVGVGETGLDYYHLTRNRKEEQKETQRIFFSAQAALALKLNLPLIIHSRNAAADTTALIKEFGVKRAIIHCFSEDLKFAQDLLTWSDEIYFSFSGILTYRNAPAVQETARRLMLGRILVETDAPFLPPQAVRDTIPVNEPAFTRHIMDFLKTLRSEPGDVVEQTVWENSNGIFGIKD
jgi:TatD DNase family protein